MSGESTDTDKRERKDRIFDLDLDRLLDENPLLGIAIFQDNRIKYANNYLSDIVGYSISK